LSSRDREYQVCHQNQQHQERAMPDDNPSHGTAIIVGAGGGLGTAIVQGLAAEGYPVALLARDDNRLQNHAAELAGSGHTARAYRADAGDPENLSAAISRAVDELGEPDILVYNVAVLAPDKPTELTAAEWNSRFAVNMTGAKVAADAVLPRLRGGHGTLLFTGGGYSLRPSPKFTALSAGKAALRAYVLALFEDQRPLGGHAATVTIAGNIGDPGFEPAAIARRHLELLHQPPGQWTAEILHSGDTSTP
jgi:NAD(P)-dependent dehydrogenase (short-subunit alcohol dehydrogenase family)